MRRKIVRNKRPIVTGKLITLATVRMGVERKHIARNGNTCIILGETNEDL